MTKPSAARRGVRAMAGAAVIVLAAAGCGGPAAHRPGTSAQPVRAQPLVLRGVSGHVAPADPRLIGAADTAFGLDLLGAWCRTKPTANLVFSPVSLADGLGLAYLGARGPTAAAMARVLHLPAGGARAEADMRAGWTALGRAGGDGVTLTGSNRVWAGIRPLRSYLDAVATAYSAGLSALPADPVQAARLINAAVARDTHGHIPELVTPQAVAPDAWVLTNALYLKAAWAAPFDAGQTRPGRFHAAAGGPVTARFMHGDGYRYATADGWTGVALPYRGGRLAMTALLPPAGAAASSCQVPAQPALNTIAAAVTGPGGAEQRAGITLPTVSLDTHQSMNSLLIRLGMGVAFSGAADFTGLSPMAGSISFVEHAATLQVGEKGTVGSAATAVGVTTSAGVGSPGPRIDFDRPYLMLVTDTGTGEPLFMARVADPAAGSAR